MMMMLTAGKGLPLRFRPLFVSVLAVVGTILLFDLNIARQQLPTPRNIELSSSSSSSSSSSVLEEGQRTTSCQPALLLHNNNNNESSVQDACHCLASQAWQNGFTSSPNSILAGYWQSAPFQTILNKVARQGVSECWNWEGALDAFDESAFQNATNLMLQELTGHQLKKAVKTRPHPFPMERIVQVLLNRLSDPTKHPPLKIAVFGGSVAWGTNSRANSFGLHVGGKSFMRCAWAFQLETLLNGILLGSSSSSSSSLANHYQTQASNNNRNNSSNNNSSQKIVMVKNFAVGGSDSEIGNALLVSNIFRDELKSYDIIINAFGANDSMLGREDAANNRLYVSAQKFARLAKAQRPCSDLPLVVNLDDVHFESIDKFAKHGLRHAREMVQASHWGGAMSVSYPDVVRDIIYKRATRPADRFLFHEFNQLHPGFTTHMGFAWTMAYSLLDGMIDACDADSLPNHDSADEPRAGYPLPILENGLKYTQVTAKWQQESERQHRLCKDNANNTETTCVYKWLAAYNAAHSAKDVERAVKSVATNIQGWEATGNPVKKPRRTWIASGGLNSTFTIQLNDIATPINRLMVMYIKSYGDRWAGSKLEIVIEAKGDGISLLWKELERTTMSGLHDSETSINYAHYIDLDQHNLMAGSSVQVTFTLVGGRVFQINAITACHVPM